MKPSDELIEKFQKAYFEIFKEEISHKEAYEKFTRLANLLRVILYPKSPWDKEGKGSGPISS